MDTNVICPICNRKICDMHSNAALILDNHIERCVRRNSSRASKINYNEEVLFEQTNNSDNEYNMQILPVVEERHNDQQPYQRIINNESMLIQDDWEEHCYRDRLEILYNKYGSKSQYSNSNSSNSVVEDINKHQSTSCDYAHSLLLQDDESSCNETIFEYKFPCIITKFHTKIFMPTWSTLHNYQKEGCEWLYSLYEQGVGGILGDEMGLGKTAQVCSHFGSLAMQQHDNSSSIDHHINTTSTTSANKNNCDKTKSDIVVHRTTSSSSKGIFIIVCPATVLHHWLQEMHQWAPFIRTVVLHSASSTASELIKLGNEGIIRVLYKLMKKTSSKYGLAVITTYEGLRRYRSALISIAWTAVCLDEGQKIRNPMTEITSTCKMLPAFHRVILSGTPIQNSLRELWSLFDFIYPGRLGSLPVFETEFVTPIRVGGYANAHKLSYEIAVRCAMTLQQTVKPHLLRRKKDDLIDITKLPPKTEQVLFCQISNKQKELYMNVLGSAEVKAIIERRMMAFRAINVLRQLCNHPALVELDGKIQQLLHSKQLDMKGKKRHLEKDDIDRNNYNNNNNDEDENENDIEDYQGLLSKLESGGIVWADSGKLLVLSKLLPLWFAEGHKVLIFSQTRGMLSIIESMIREFRFHYLRLDGNTPVSKRAGIVQKFNNDPNIFVMLLTTRTGGVGISLTAANRVVLFDPDWNPMTDIQSRERAWRLGQTREVTIYRLISKGTIEEKIYQRQIFKVLLSNRILENAKQKSLFSQNQIRDLFELQGYDDAAYLCSYPGSKARIDSLPKEGEVDLLDDENTNIEPIVETIPLQSQLNSYISSSSILRQQQHKDGDPTHSYGLYSNKDIDTSSIQSTSLSQLGVHVEQYIEPDIALLQHQQQQLEHIDEDAELSTIDGSNSRDRKLLQALFAGEAITSVYDHDYLLAPSTTNTTTTTNNNINNNNNNSIAKLSNGIVSKEEKVLFKAKADQIMKQALQKLITSATTYNGCNNNNIISTNYHTSTSTTTSNNNNNNNNNNSNNTNNSNSNTSNSINIHRIVVNRDKDNVTTKSSQDNNILLVPSKSRFGNVSATGNAILSSSSTWLSANQHFNNIIHNNNNNNNITNNNNNNNNITTTHNNKHHTAVATTSTTTIKNNVNNKSNIATISTNNPETSHQTISLSIRQDITERLHNIFNKAKNPITTTFILYRFKDLGDHYAPLFKEILKNIAIHNNGTWTRRIDA